ncbi:MAG: MaoC/PaaZ C-terminal domain-containing protein [Chloroflexota bacterium]|nr:MaoC/PaaZ C-terminal domain-containing protein [Chloroflexota bacterium]
MASPILDNATIPTLTKSITEESILQFESCGILERENIHNNYELAARRLGTTYTLASGRMSITFASEALRRFFGPETFNHSGSVNLKFLRPVKNGDTITVSGSVIQQDAVENGTQVTVQIQCHNQNGDTTAVGQGYATVPQS